MRTTHLLCLLLLALALIARPGPAAAEHLRDLADVSGARGNQLLGYGLVTGLANTGDDINAPFTAQSVLAMLRRLGVQADPAQFRLRNVAAVMVTASIPAFARQGTTLDVTVSSIGNARSLAGGVLLQTILRGADQRAYALAQGPITTGGFAAQGATGTTVRSGTITVGRIAQGASVEHEIPATLVTDGALRLNLRRPGFTVASRIAAAVNQRYGAGTASTRDSGAVAVRVPADAELVDFIAGLEDLDVSPVRQARVVINERTGTIIATQSVRISTVAVSHGSLTITIASNLGVSQPAPFSQGTTAVVPSTQTTATEQKGGFKVVDEFPTLQQVASALNALGLTTRDMMAIFQSMKRSGALQAELILN